MWLRATFNTALYSTFWLQHLVMSKHWFKEYMNTQISLIRGQYCFFERPLFGLLAGLMLTMIVFLSQPIPELVVIQPLQSRFTSDLLTKIAITLTVLGVYIFGTTLIDMLRCDVFGFDHIRAFKEEGLHFPFQCEQRRLSRVALSCRHSLFTGMLIVLLGALLCPTANGLTYNRLMINAIFSAGLLIGIYFEEREYKRRLGIGRFSEYCKLVPNMVLPDLGMILFSSSERYEHVKARVVELS